ncbi:MAG: sugar nucleotide-binding protein, partial [Candidatus Peribacteraceae bacterium]|nr:sugar nucleotide-binding protein [Candidatus Peribacteraceae bacterium]
SKGYLGQQFLSAIEGSIPSIADIAEPEQVRRDLDLHKPDVIINAAGKTGRPNIDWCEDHKVETVRSNVTGPLVLAEESAKRGVHFVQLNSGCIYTGNNDGDGFCENNPANFTGSFYSRMKALVDQILIEFDNVLILRLRMPFDGSNSERSLINKLKKFKKVHDIENSITYIPDFLKATIKLIEKKRTGIYNMVNSGITSPYKIMQIYKEMVDPTHEFELLPVEDLDSVSKAKRSNCVLNSNKLKEEGVSMLSVDEAIRKACLEMKKIK